MLYSFQFLHFPQSYKKKNQTRGDFKFNFYSFACVLIFIKKIIIYMKKNGSNNNYKILMWSFNDLYSKKCQKIKQWTIIQNHYPLEASLNTAIFLLLIDVILSLKLETMLLPIVIEERITKQFGFLFSQIYVRFEYKYHYFKLARMTRYIQFY